MRTFSMALLAGIATVTTAGAGFAQLSMATTASSSASKLAAKAPDAVAQNPSQLGTLGKVSNSAAALASTQTVSATAPTSKLGQVSGSTAPQDARLSGLSRPSNSASKIAAASGGVGTVSSAVGRNAASGNMLELGKGAAATQPAK